jgi:long-chain acyl-CoA synthetase
VNYTALDNQLLFHAIKTPEKIALISDSGTWTYQRLNHEVTSFSQKIISAGASPNDFILIWLEDKDQVWISILSIMRAKAIPIISDPEIDNIVQIYNDLSPKIIITNKILEHSSTHQFDLSVFLYFIFLKNDIDVDKMDYRKNSENDIGLVSYTSGTTSDCKKGVLIQYKALEYTSHNLINLLNMTSEIKEIIISNIHHAFGLGRCRAVLKVGGTMVMESGEFNPAKAILSIESNMCNSISGVSSIFSVLLKYFKKDLIRVQAQIKWVEFGSVSPGKDIVQIMLETFYNAKIIQNYGLTEAMRSAFSVVSERGANLESVGRPTKDVKIRIVGRNNSICNIGQIGEIQVKGVNLAYGYINKNKEWKDKISEGWFMTGDLGRVDSDGYIYYVGRSDNIINIGGEKVSSEYIETQIKSLMGDFIFSICGVDDPNNILQQVPILFIEGRKKVRIDISKFTNVLRRYQVPRNVFFINKFPRTSSGKIRRSELKKMYNFAVVIKK